MQRVEGGLWSNNQHHWPDQQDIHDGRHAANEISDKNVCFDARTLRRSVTVTLGSNTRSLNTDETDIFIEVLQHTESNALLLQTF